MCLVHFYDLDKKLLTLNKQLIVWKRLLYNNDGLTSPIFRYTWKLGWNSRVSETNGFYVLKDKPDYDMYFDDHKSILVPFLLNKEDIKTIGIDENYKYRYTNTLIVKKLFLPKGKIVEFKNNINSWQYEYVVKGINSKANKEKRLV